jgi:thioredoxin reductase (NADPH)
VSYCAICDADLYVGGKVLVVGGGDAAVEEALYLTEFASEVFIAVRRDTLRATEVLKDRAIAHPKIKFIWQAVVEEICGGEKVTSVRFRNTQSGERTDFALDGVFVFIGSESASQLVESLVEVDREGYVITDDAMQTSCTGIFAAGDIRVKPLRQVVTAVGDGAVATVSAQKFLSNG